MPDRPQVYEQNDDDSGIRKSDERMFGAAGRERRERERTGRLRVNLLDPEDWTVSPQEHRERAESAHREMQSQAEAGMDLRRGRERNRELVKRLSDVMKDEPKRSKSRAGGKRR